MEIQIGSQIPRQGQNGKGEISPVSFKRKLRDLIDDHDSLFFRSLPEFYVEHAENFCILKAAAGIVKRSRVRWEKMSKHLIKKSS